MAGVRNEFITYIYCSELLKKAACLFAGLGHLQPLLLATTNSHYLLDRFCMERCCSSEYISRIVTSIIFMEILSILVVRIVLYGALRDNSNKPGAGTLVTYTRKEEEVRDSASIAILWMIFLGYLQIFYAFTTGGKKGHMHWFYTSLLIQHFLNSLIAGSIGFWEVGRALWYLVTLPMAPIVLFFYQLMIHSWIRNHGPRDAEYIVVECQIWLALLLSSIATIFWTAGYAIPHIPYKQPADQLDLSKLDDPASSGNGITVHHSTPASLNVYSTTGVSANASSATIQSTNSNVEVKVHSITVTLTGGTTTPVIVYPGVTLKSGATVQSDKPATAKVTANLDNSKNKVTITVPTKPEYKKVVPVKSTRATLNIDKMYLALDPVEAITVKDTSNGAGTDASPTATVKGYACYPNKGYYISQTSEGSVWKSEWDGGKCFYAECYCNGAAGNNPALLKLYVLGNTLKIMYFGKNSNWYVIKTDAEFREKVKELERTGEFTGLTTAGTPAQDESTTQNTYFTKVLCDGWIWKFWEWPWKKHSATWYPLLMQGLSVGAVGSIFPNLIPKTLTCPKTTRNLSVMNMFLVTLPHIINVMLGDMDLLGRIGTGAPWEKPFHTVWLLYLIYALAILFAIFNIHYY